MSTYLSDHSSLGRIIESIFSSSIEESCSSDNVTNFLCKSYPDFLNKSKKVSSTYATKIKSAMQMSLLILDT